ncbi:hypothetical protein ABZV31_02600 [Streptomyces sp. NPDC005202]|uniref:hypothetical protein n=1 Tax=Streptomyces sp. NPDC005202 TaxID=3157021 RepID=UPI0033AB9152
MNTERPDHDDAAEPGAADAAGTARGTDDTAGEVEQTSAPAEREQDATDTGVQAAPQEPDTSGTEARAATDEPDTSGTAQAATQEPDTSDTEARAAAMDELDTSGTDVSAATGEKGVVGDRETVDVRPARRRSPLVAASVAAAVLLVGGGGAYLAASASGGSGGGTGPAASGGHGTPPPLALDGYSSGGTNGIAPGEPNPYGATYRVGGTLPGGPGSASVYAAKGEVTQDEVARLAKALGVDGTPVADAQAWRVGPGKDGSGPSLQVSRQAPGTWTFSRYAPGTDDCKGVLCTHDPAAPAVHPVSVAAAEKAAAPVLKALGQDDAKVDASQIMGAQRVVNADPVVGGLPTYGWTTGLSVSRQGEVVSGSGQLKAPTKGDTYPVLNARKTLDLMNAAPRTDHRMGIGGCASPEPLKDRLEAPCGSPTIAQEVLTVDKAVFGLASHSSNGRQTLVPSWLFEVRGPGAQDRFTVTYPAVDPKYLASPTTPSGQPSAQPSGSGSAPATHDVKVTGYSTEGDDLTVGFEGGVCADYKTSAKESSGKVTVTVTETPWRNKVCIMIAKMYHQTLHLDRPLGDRTVVGSDGREIPKEKGARLPESSSAR